MTTFTAFLLIATLLAVLLWALAGWFVAFRLTHPTPSQERLTLTSLTETAAGTMVALPATPATSARGRYGIWFNRGTAHARLGPVVDRGPHTVTRLVEAVSGGQLTADTRYRWSGITHLHPSELGLTSTHAKDVPGGPEFLHVPAVDTTSTQWAIHIHGLGGTAASTLRAFPTFHSAGYHSLTTTYHSPDSHLTTLGQTEWHQLDHLLSYAVRSGATTVVLVGWSMGAAIAQQLVTRSHHAAVIKGALLIAPSLNWEDTIRHSAQHLGIPTWAARAGSTFVQHSLLSRTIGLSAPINLRSMSWLESVQIDTLIVHNPADRTTPHHISATYSLNQNSHVELISAESSGHTLEWNSNSELCSEAVSAWLLNLSTKGSR